MKNLRAATQISVWRGTGKKFPHFKIFLYLPHLSISPIFHLPNPLRSAVNDWNFGLNWLVYAPTSYYIFDLVKEFYNGFAKSNNSDDYKSFKLKWRGWIITVHAMTISAVTGILLHNGHQILFAIEKYLTKMGPNFTMTWDRRISRTILYHNIHAACCWII